MSNTISITPPDDWHVHLRDGDMLKRTAHFTASQFRRALVMPNLRPPVTTVESAVSYRQSILHALANDSVFDPKMSIYLTDHTSVSEVERAAENDHIMGFKLYPAGATTHSESGVTRISNIMTALEAMADHGVVLQVHGEVTDEHIDIFDREAEFIEQVLMPINRELPELRIVLEHVTTAEGVDFVKNSSVNVAATITPQHLLFNRNEIFKGGIRPHMYCLPVLKREKHRRALLDVVSSGDSSFFLGTDSAPHTRSAKLSDCGCAGIFSACSAIELYAEIFDQMACLDKLEGFASHYGADFYHLPRNPGKVTLHQETWEIPTVISDSNSVAENDLIPLLGGANISWKLHSFL